MISARRRRIGIAVATFDFIISKTLRRPIRAMEPEIFAIVKAAFTLHPQQSSPLMR